MDIIGCCKIRYDRFFFQIFPTVDLYTRVNEQSDGDRNQKEHDGYTNRIEEICLMKIGATNCIEEDRSAAGYDTKHDTESNAVCMSGGIL